MEFHSPTVPTRNISSRDLRPSIPDGQNTAPVPSATCPRVLRGALQPVARPLLFLFSLIAIFLGPDGAVGDDVDRLLRSRDRRVLRLEEIATDLESASLVFMGELHSEKIHHDNQLAVVKMLHERSDGLAIAVEMIEARQQDVLDRWIRGGIEEIEFTAFFEEQWPTTWHLYRDIFLFARQHRIPMIGLNIPGEITEQVAREGFFSLTREQMARLPGVSCNIDEEYRKLMRMVVDFHEDAGDEGKGFDRFCEAQMVWDTTMAQRILDYTVSATDPLVVVMAGNTHAWKYGIPEQVRRKSHSTDLRVILQEIPGFQTRADIRPERTDYLWLLRGY